MKRLLLSFLVIALLILSAYAFYKHPFIMTGLAIASYLFIYFGSKKDGYYSHDEELP